MSLFEIPTLETCSYRRLSFDLVLKLMKISSAVALEPLVVRHELNPHLLLISSHKLISPL